MSSGRDIELTRAFVAVFESIAVARGLLPDRKRHDAVSLMDDAMRRTRTAMRGGARQITDLCPPEETDRASDEQSGSF